jgi:hypothetical protein
MELIVTSFIATFSLIFGHLGMVIVEHLTRFRRVPPVFCETPDACGAPPPPGPPGARQAVAA